MAQYQAVIQLADLDGTDGFRIDGVQKYDGLGISLASAGDVNGDGFGDIMVGAIGAQTDDVVTGQAYVLFGGPAGGFAADLNVGDLDGANGFTIAGSSLYSQLGGSVSSAGDLNGDGVDDLFVSAVAGDQGQAYLVFGGASLGADGRIDAADLDGANGFVIDGGGLVGTQTVRVSGAGDVNGDGVDDLLVGVPSFNYGHGLAYVVFGKTGGYAPELDVAALDGTNGFVLTGPNSAATIGSGVHAAGDVNGDGLADLLVESRYAGQAYVVFGSTSAFDASLDLTTLGASQGFRIDATGAGAVDAGPAGDVNGDGLMDLVIGQKGADNNGVDSGSTYVVFGRTSVAGPLDVTALSGADGFRIDGAAAGDQSGNAVSSAGDVNGDGFADLLIGASHADHVGLYGYSGAAYVVFGKAGGFDPAIDLADLDGADGFKIAGSGTEFLGGAVSSAGDINGDGLADLQIGAADAEYGFAPGHSYVVFGKEVDVQVDLEGTIASQTLVGGAFDDTLHGRQGDDALWGHGGRDHLFGGAGDDTLTGGAGGGDRLAGNAGGDTFAFRAVSDSSDRTSADVIRDLGAGDVIDLSVIDADTTADGDQAFTLVTAFTRHAGELRLRLADKGGHTWLDADTDGDGHADFSVRIKGDHQDFTDFVL